MSIPSAFLEAVKQKNILSVRIMMKDSLLFEPTFKTFEEMKKYASRLHGLYDDHNGEELLSDSRAWDNAYLDRQMARVVRNFSKERLEHLRNVVQHLRPTPDVTSTIPQDNKTRRLLPAGEYRSYTTGCNKNIIIGAAAGILAFGLATPLISSLAARIAIGATVGCGAAYTCHRRSRRHE